MLRYSWIARANDVEIVATVLLVLQTHCYTTSVAQMAQAGRTTGLDAKGPLDQWLRYHAKKKAAILTSKRPRRYMHLSRCHANLLTCTWWNDLSTLLDLYLGTLLDCTVPAKKVKTCKTWVLTWIFRSNRNCFPLYIFADLLGIQCGSLCSFILPICLVQGQFQLESGYQVLPPRRRWDLCGEKLHQFGRKDRSFRYVGVGAWRCRAQEFLLGLWHDFEMAVGSGRSTLGSENRKELKRLNQCLRNSLIANWFKSWCFVVVPFPRLNREEGGCLSSSLLLSMCCVLHLMKDEQASCVRALVANRS